MKVSGARVVPQQRATCREQSSSGAHYLRLTRRAASWTKKRLATGKEVRGDAGGARSKTVKPRSADNIKSFPLARPTILRTNRPCSGL